MSLTRYLVHLSVLCLLGTAATFAYPVEGVLQEGASHDGAASAQQRTLQLEAEMREMKRAYREGRADDRVAAQAVTFQQQMKDLEQEMRLLREEHVRFLVARAASEARAAAACLDTH